MKNQRSKNQLTHQHRSLPGLAILAGLILPSSAWAMAGMEEKIADVMTWVVLLVLPVAGLYLFWKLHVLPEVFAEKHHHPQKHAINILCLLSLLFGGLLWPFAWLWAFSKPVGYKMAYGTDKHDDYFLKPDGEHGSKPMDLAVVDDELLLLQEKVSGLTKKRNMILDRQPQINSATNQNKGNQNA